MTVSFLSLLRDNRGSAAPVIAITLGALVAAAGAATDYARAQMVQTKLADTLDAAGLAAGATQSSQNVQDVAQNYFNVNFPSSYMNAQPQLLSVVENDTQTSVTLTARATVPTVFMSMMGVESVTVEAQTEVERKSSGLELVLVMDNTGSMSGSKLSSLKNAASTLVNFLFGDKETQDNLWIGLVPFSQAVNVSPLHTGWLNMAHYNGLDWGPTEWAGCMDARAGGLDETDDPPADGWFNAYYWPDHNYYNNWIYTNWWGQKRYSRNIGPTRGPNKYCPQPVQRMSNVKSTVLAGIDTMEARGNTHINLGAVWGWRMLSPRWRGLWGGTMDANDLPLDYGTPYMSKAIVILSDGANTMSNSVRSAYGYLWEGLLGTTSSSTARNKLNARLANICTDMKSRNIRVYTILFQEDNWTVVDLFRNCASQLDFYFNSPSSEELETAFRQIADSLSNLRISK